MVDPSQINISRYNADTDSLEEITELLHLAYAPLAARGFNYVAATQSTDVTASRLTSGDGYIARRQGSDQIIGTVTYYTQPREADDEPDFYKKPIIGHFGQFAVLPELQKIGIGRSLLQFTETLARKEGKAEIACDTAEGATDLIEYYKRCGYRFIEYHQWNSACYRSVILRKSLKE